MTAFTVTPYKAATFFFLKKSQIGFHRRYEKKAVFTRQIISENIGKELKGSEHDGGLFILGHNAEEAA